MTSFRFPDNLSSGEKNSLLHHAQQVLAAQHAMQAEIGKSILHYTLQNHVEHLVRMAHHPRGDRIDKKTGAQYFYHCHRENEQHEEHGHFHCFLRYPQIPESIQPTPLPDWDKYLENPMTHLAAIGMNCLGQPIRLFSTNRWVTSEIIYDSSNIPKLVDRFVMTKTDSAHWQVLDQWVESMIHLFKPQIHWLSQAREQKIAELSQRYPHRNIMDDKAYEEFASIPIDLTQQVEWVLKHCQ